MFRLAAGLAQGAWMPTFYRRVFETQPAMLGAYLTVVLVTSGIIGTYAGGWLSDHFSKKRDLSGKAWVCAGSTLLSIPFLFIQYLLSNQMMSLGALFFGSIFGKDDMIISFL